MHKEAYRNCEKFFNEYVKPGMTILDIGSYDINGTLKPIFADYHYVGCDLEPGPNVDVVLDDPYVLPFVDNSFDVLVSSSCFEHCKFFWVTFEEMVRVTKRYIYVQTPSIGGYHGYPCDYWRFQADAYQALADWGRIKLLEAYIDKTSVNWHDHIGVFEKC